MFVMITEVDRKYVIAKFAIFVNNAVNYKKYDFLGVSGLMWNAQKLK